MNQIPRQTDIEEFAQPIDLFSYAALSREDEAAAREDAALIKAHMKSAAESIIAVGLALKRQKERLPHGMFLPWIEAEFGLSDRSAQRFMLRAERWSKSANLAGLTPMISASVLDEATDPSLPAEVRDRVESLLVDGQKVTVADIRKMKADAKAKDDSIGDLAARNTELAQQVVEPVIVTLDEEALRAEGKAEAERDLRERINALSNENVASADAIKALKNEIAALKAAQSPKPADETNVVRPAFGDPAQKDEDDYSSEEKAISAFSGAIGSMEGLEFSAAAFWEKQGKRGTHGKRLHQALLSVNATIGLLIKEYAK